MAGSSDFLQWNPSKVNQQDDAAFEADSTRSGGAAVGQPFRSDLANKLFYQLTTGMAGMMQMLATKGYDVSDASLNDLVAVLANLMTLADMAPYAPLDSPEFTGTPKAPAPAVKDASNRIATTGWVAGQSTLAAVGFITLPNGLLIQWCTGPSDPADASEPSHVINFPKQFPTACFACFVSKEASAASGHSDNWYETAGWTRDHVTIQRQMTYQGNFSGAVTRALVLALGV